MLEKEIIDTKDPYRLAALQVVYQNVCSDEVVLIDKSILNRSEQVRHMTNIKYKDSIHLACAEAAHADYLLTTDKKFESNCKRIETFTKVINPNEYLMEVLYK